MNVKKLIAILAATSTLAACQTDDTTAPEPATDETDEEIETHVDEDDLDDEPSEVVVSDEDMEPVSDDELANAEPIDDLSQYEEFEEQEVFNPEEYDAYLISDEGGIREIIFTEDSEQVFKSIFVIEDNILRVIDLVNSELLINDPI